MGGQCYSIGIAGAESAGDPKMAVFKGILVWLAGTDTPPQVGKKKPGTEKKVAFLSKNLITSDLKMVPLKVLPAHNTPGGKGGATFLKKNAWSV